MPFRRARPLHLGVRAYDFGMGARRSAMRTRSASERARILRMTWPRCTLTVTSLIPSSAAICLFGAPGGDELHDLALALGQRGVARLQLGDTPASRRRARSRSSAAWIASSSSWSWKGLARNSTAPAFMARTLIGTSPWPVMKMTGRAMPAFTSSCVEREAALAGQPHVEHEAAGRVGPLGPQELLR